MAGVRKMYEDRRPCLDVVQQIVAVRSALTGVARDLLSNEASRCARSRRPDDFDRILKSLVELS